MNKKIVIGCIGIVFMLVAITAVSAVNNKIVEKKESPLFKKRINKYLKPNLKEKLHFKFFRNRIYYNLGFSFSNEVNEDTNLVSRAITLFTCPAIRCCKLMIRT